ncbi:MAG: ABC transporter substrate-binding protein [Anaerolineae bacterium]
MHATTMSRRKLLRFASAIGGTAALAACGATPAPAATSAPEATNAPAPTNTPSVDSAGTQAAANKAATEDAISEQARTEEEIFDLTAEDYAARMDEELAQAASTGKTVIELLCAYGTIIEDKTQPHFWIMRDFMQKNPDIFVKYSPASAYTGAFNEAILMRMASGDVPDAILHYSAPIAYAARGTCQVLDDLMDAHPVGNKSAWVSTALAQLQWSGKTWGVPLNGSYDAMWYNLDLLEAKGLATTRDEFPETLDELQEWTATLNEWDGDTMTVIGATPFEGNWGWYGRMVANGGSLWDGSQYSIDGEKNVELVEYWIAWIEKHYKGDIDALRAQGSLQSPYPEGAFGLGLQAIANDGLWGLTHVPPDIRYEVGKMPTGPSGTRHATSNYPNLMFIPTGAKHVQEAFELCVYYGTEGQIEWWNRWSDVPYWVDFPDNVAPQDLIARVGEEKALELTKFSRDYTEDIVVQWNSPVEDFANDEIFRAVDEALHKLGNPKDLLARAQETVTAKLDEVQAG